ncbi:hypothetical protein CAS74_002692 [Pichia kudriavzevii]|uniref:Diphosphoinositol polyphosphate phosphohydrolase DDP1 n=1 Tax=Pichia kudriavzevii TaxID=4909 RepID=A0A099NZX3_PICKU|nr:uncharacterized protein C5L36_0E05430 [Pichia kudriavzevii]AWU78487.1 hypothetical protein C5L36_0E05430 [Pichia kudriavzevii]KGK37589.1 hypothetical protein JL09_g3261 [Pichia kudriavzevii]ONH72250.1 Diphosphoinositol polyphosphate phosphohydrolase DDP1 [Pichia kudriavzevii]OUT21723.1 hypothetical protein CAS74_002692 [Pichia kudriavzevii]
MSYTKKETARVGREHQLYTKDNLRLVAGGIVLDGTHEKVLMISSAKHPDKWIIPKGGIEDDEVEDYGTAALREVWEEAGADCEIVKKIGQYKDHRLEKNSTDIGEWALCEFHFYQMKLKQLAIEWPESSTRLRRWCDYSEAKHELLKSKRPELLLALNDSDIVKNVDLLEYEHSNLKDTQLDNDDQYENI